MTAKHKTTWQLDRSFNKPNDDLPTDQTILFFRLKPNIAILYLTSQKTHSYHWLII